MAKIYRFEMHYTDTDNGEDGLSTVHYQTDVPVAGTEPSPSTVLNLILNHFSSTGHNCTKWTNAMYNSAVLTKAVVREEVAPGSGDVPGTSEELLSLPGTLSIGSGVQCPSGLCLWLKFGTGVALRSARGGTHTPGAMSVLVLNQTGQFDQTTSWWTNSVALAAAIKDKLDNVFSSTGDINPGVYSRTRRARGFDPFFFELDVVTPDIDPRWLRRRAQL